MAEGQQLQDKKAPRGGYITGQKGAGLTPQVPKNAKSVIAEKERHPSDSPERKRE
jgi:hypothetical protein